MDFNYGDFDALFTGDIGEEEENLIRPGLEQSKARPFDVLKVAHHGSKYSSSLDFLKAVKPALAVIEVGKNSYGHPTAEAIDRLKAVGAKVFRTDQDGEVMVETDGKRWRVTENSNLKTQISKLSSKLKIFKFFSF
jgi:competence protein ComEC